MNIDFIITRVFRFVGYLAVASILIAIANFFSTGSIHLDYAVYLGNLIAWCIWGLSMIVEGFQECTNSKST